MRKLIVIILLTPLLMARCAGEGRAKLLLPQKEALRLAFPAGAQVEKKTAFLSVEQALEAQKLARVKVSSLLWTYYVARSTQGVLGYAYFDRVIIRTMPATVMACLDAEGRVRFVEILTFGEPEDYLPRPRWLKLFEKRGLSDDLRVHGVIRNVSGATLTSESLTRSVRRMLAIHRVLHP